MNRLYLLTRLSEGKSAVIVRLNRDISQKCFSVLSEGNGIMCRRRIKGIGGIYIYSGRKIFISEKEAGFVVCADE